MSFSHEVKEELAKRIGTARHCQMAELAAIFNFVGQFGCIEKGKYTIGFQTENETVVRKGFTLLKKTFNIEAGAEIDEPKLQEIFHKFGDLNKPVNPLLVKNSCCQRAFLRGAFLSIGSVSAPEKGYHLELVCTDEEKAEQLREIMLSFEIESKIVKRKKYFVVYMKEGKAIVELLNVMEAHIALMNLENLRILKEVRNTVNRRVNCEAANISKTVEAAGKQIEEILLIKEKLGFNNLPANLKQIAEARLENPEMPLKELGEELDPPVGKSGVNHRLRKLSEIAKTLR